MIGQSDGGFGILRPEHSRKVRVVVDRNNQINVCYVRGYMLLIA